ncbi:hypothetical protein RT41_GL000648 [Lactococcus fujiensis JCM 16395]|uniref:Uncharacterized protein n=1 Tax=Lactococcus fujiensis JCM 16395 TaxID=1291764 RepID=A0A2A5RIC3_9LACT|nr:hypothetical protein RT41_GL000648 [Lactococcus fujiensis JCM 16395]
MYKAKQTFLSKDGRIITFGTKVNSVAGYPVKFFEKLEEETKNENDAVKTGGSRTRKTTKQD